MYLLGAAWLAACITAGLIVVPGRRERRRFRRAERLAADAAAAAKAAVDAAERQLTAEYEALAGLRPGLAEAGLRAAHIRRHRSPSGRYPVVSPRTTDRSPGGPPG